jgi:putative transposase
MKPPPDPHYRHRFPAEIISHAVWLYHVFSLSLRDVELLLAERGVVVSYESIRQWCKKFGQTFASRLRRRRPRPGDRWHMDEVFIRIEGAQHYSLACRGSGRHCARHPGSATAGRQSREALLEGRASVVS